MGGMENDGVLQETNNSRKEIIKESWAKSLCPELRCYKHYLSDMSFTESEAKETMKRVSKMVCPNKGWKLHQDGVTPEVAYEHEKQSKSLKVAKQGVLWSQLAFWAVIISIIIGAIYFLISYFYSS